MNTDANTDAEEEVLMPTTTSDGGIDAHLDAKEPVESSTTSEEQHEEKQSGYQKRINDLTAKRYQAEREKDEIAAKLAQYESQQQQAPTPASVDVKAPDLPEDLYDDEAMRKYHSENIKYQESLAESKARSVFESQQKEGVQRKQQEQQKKVVDSYVNNALKDGVDLDKLRASEATLNQAGIRPELGAYIMNDVNGAKIAEYLADNPADMHDLFNMDPVSAGIEIATKIKPKVLSQTPKVSNAPDPVPEIKGGGYVEVDDFDKTYPGVEFI